MPGDHVRGVIFDLDGTLVDSRLDFAAIRREMGLPEGQPILEAMREFDARRTAACRLILERHEQEGAEQAAPMPGAKAFVADLHRRGVSTAVLTRNAREIAVATLARIGLEIDLVLGREDGPIKPDPAGILLACGRWNIPPESAAMVGDYRFDMQAGRNAGARTVLYTQGRDAAGLPGVELADFCLTCFTQATALLAWLGLQS